jgi:hypothetical protein
VRFSLSFFLGWTVRGCAGGLSAVTLRIYFGPNIHYPDNTFRIIHVSMIVAKVLFTDSASIHVYEYRSIAKLPPN